MKFNSFNFISPCIDETKRFIKPLSFRQWLKMGFISLLAGGTGGGSGFRSGGSPNINIPGNRGWAGTNSTDKITGGSVIDSLNSSVGYLIGAVVFLFAILWLFLTYISSVFSFVFIECIDTKKILIRKPFHRNKALGLSLFWFRIIVGFCILILVALLMIPVVLLILNIKNGSGEAAIAIVLWLILAILLFAIVMLPVGIILSLIFNFSFLHMYFRRIPMWPSIRATFREIWKNKVEVLVFLVARLVVGIVVGLAALVGVLILLLVLGLVFVPIGLGIYFLGQALAWSVPMIVLAVMLGICALLFFIYCVNVVLLPFSVFGRYFSIRNYWALMGKKNV